MRYLSFAIVLLFLLTACQRYTIGAENAAPRVVSSATEIRTLGLSAETRSGEETAQSVEGSGELPEIANAKQLVEGAFANARGSRAEREEAAVQLESARETLQVLAESGTISHWENLEEEFEVATEKVREGTNDAPNALYRLLEGLKEATTPRE